MKTLVHLRPSPRSLHFDLLSHQDICGRWVAVLPYVLHVAVISMVHQPIVIVPLPEHMLRIINCHLQTETGFRMILMIVVNMREMILMMISLLVAGVRMNWWVLHIVCETVNFITISTSQLYMNTKPFGHNSNQ